MWVESYIIPTVKKRCILTVSMEQISLTVQFARLDEGAILPTQGSALAAGWDMYSLEDTVVPKGSSVLIRTGWAAAIPEGWEGQLRCRSSLGKKGMIMPNGIGTIDADYRGELMVLATWIGQRQLAQKHGLCCSSCFYAPRFYLLLHDRSAKPGLQRY